MVFVGPMDRECYGTPSFTPFGTCGPAVELDDGRTVNEEGACAASGAGSGQNADILSTIGVYVFWYWYGRFDPRRSH